MLQFGQDITGYMDVNMMLTCIKLYSPRANKERSFVKVMVFRLPDFILAHTTVKLESSLSQNGLKIQNCVSRKFGYH